MRITISKNKPNKIRYVGQKDGHSCGPISILNILKWCGYNATKKYLKDLKKYCKTTRQGTKSKNISLALSRYKKIKSKFVNRISLKILDDHLDNGFAALILHSKWIKDEPERHYFIIIEKKEKFGRIYYKTVNWADDKTVNYLTRRKLNKVFKRSLRSNKDPRGWLIKRKDL